MLLCTVSPQTTIGSLLLWLTASPWFVLSSCFLFVFVILCNLLHLHRLHLFSSSSCITSCCPRPFMLTQTAVSSLLLSTTSMSYSIAASTQSCLLHASSPSLTAYARTTLNFAAGIVASAVRQHAVMISLLQGWRRFFLLSFDAKFDNARQLRLALSSVVLHLEVSFAAARVTCRMSFIREKKNDCMPLVAIRLVYSYRSHRSAS